MSYDYLIYNTIILYIKAQYLQIMEHLLSNPNNLSILSNPNNPNNPYNPFCFSNRTDNIDQSNLSNPMVNTNTIDINTNGRVSFYEFDCDKTMYMTSYSIDELYDVLSNILNEDKITKGNDKCTNILIQDVIFNKMDLNMLFLNVDKDDINEPLFFTTKKFVVFFIDKLKGVVTKNKIYLAINECEHKYIHKVIQFLETLDTDEYFFEYFAYYSLLNTIYFENDSYINYMAIKTKNALEKINRTNNFSFESQNTLRKMKNEYTKKINNVSKIEKKLSDFIQDRHKIAKIIFLKEKFTANNSIFIKISDNIVNLFETYIYHFKRLSNKLDTCLVEIKHCEENVLSKTNYSRNNLMILNMIISILMIAISFCSYITGLFGMNLDNVKDLQPINGIFNGVVVSTIIFIPIATFLTIFILSKLNYFSLNFVK